MITEEQQIGQEPQEAASSPGGSHIPALNPKKRRRTSRLLTGVTVLILCGAGFLWWRSGQQQAPVRFSIVTASQGSITKLVTATGTVNPELTIIVGTYVSGVIQSVYCDYNTQVKKGQLCAKIDPRPYQTIVDQDRANVATAKSQLEKDKAALAYATLTFQRDTSLLKDGVVSQDTFDNAKSAYNELQAQTELDQSTIAQDQAQLNTAEVNLGYTDITSPVDGTVVLRNVTLGQTVAASFQTPTLFLIATNLARMQVDTNVSESDMGDLREKNRASFTVEAFPNRTFEGIVAQVRQAPQTVQNVVTYDIVVAVANRDLALKPGMTATVKIVTGERKDVLRVPDQALRYVPGGLTAISSPPPATASSPAARSSTDEQSIWILRDNKPLRIGVKLGLDDDSFTEVTGGDLRAGDQVIISEQSDSRQRGGWPGRLPKF